MQPSKSLVILVCALAVAAGCGAPAQTANETRLSTTDTTESPAGTAVPTPETTPVPTTPAPRTTATPTVDRSETAWSRQGRTVTVVEVVDGDTMDVRFENGTVERVRLLGVDTPEVYGGNDP